MLDLFNIAKPQGCDIQIFYGAGGGATSTAAQYNRTWTKPRGVSNVYMLLIGGGGGGGGTDGSSGNGRGGGSGAVTVWYGAAQHVPDVLTVYPGRRGTAGTSGGGSGDSGGRTQVSYYTTSLVSLLSADGGFGGTGNSTAGTTNGGAAMTANAFAACGFFQSVAGDPGKSGSAISASATTFLTGGLCNSDAITPNYGYPPSSNAALASGGTVEGYFQLQPIIVGRGGNSSNPTPNGGVGGVGCGGGGGNQNGASSGGFGGQGMVLIASW